MDDVDSRSPGECSVLNPLSSPFIVVRKERLRNRGRHLPFGDLGVSGRRVTTV